MIHGAVNDVWVVATRDDEHEARLAAEKLWLRRRKTGVMRTTDWNLLHPDDIVRTADRFVIISEPALPVLRGRA